MAQYRPPDNTYVPPPAPISVQPAHVFPGTQADVQSSPLAYLDHVDQLIVKQEIHLLDVALNYTTNVRFVIQNIQGQPFLTAEEQNDCCNRNCCQNSRSFEINIKDNSGFTQIVLRRPLRICGCCFPCCCLQELTVESPPGNVIGYVQENWHIFVPAFTICDAGRNEIFKVTGDCCPSAKLCYCGRDINFEVVDVRTGQAVGRVSKHWAGVIQETVTNASNFGISFPMSMSITQKSLLLSLAFLLDFMFFEINPNRGSSSSSSNNN